MYQNVIKFPTNFFKFSFRVYALISYICFGKNVNTFARAKQSQHVRKGKSKKQIFFKHSARRRSLQNNKQIPNDQRLSVKRVAIESVIHLANPSPCTTYHRYFQVRRIHASYPRSMRCKTSLCPFLRGVPA